MPIKGYGLENPEEVVITAVGVISPLGANYPQTIESLKAGRDCAGGVTLFDTSQSRCQRAAEIPGEWLLPFQDRRKRLHRASCMTIAAMRELAAQDPGFRPQWCITGTTSGGMSFGEEFARFLFRSLPPLGPRLDATPPGPLGPLGSWGAGKAVGRAPGNTLLARKATLLANYQPQKMVQDALQAVGYSIPPSPPIPPSPANPSILPSPQCSGVSTQILANACSSGSNAIGHGFNLIRHRLAQRVLCGGYDALSQMVFVGFDSLQASTTSDCSPFDKNRTGLILGEGAAFLALESRSSAQARKAPILGRITGYGISTDNHHLTQPHPSGIGPRLAMQRALESAGRRSVDYINAHGTGTLFNDSTEGLAILELGMGAVPVSSTKSMMGHSLGAAGAIEAVISLIALREGFLPPNIHFNQPELPLEIIANQARPALIRSVLSNSFGFGGTNAAIILEQA